MDGCQVNLRPIRLASDRKLANWRTGLERALLSECPPDETQARWAAEKGWVRALVAAIADEQADRARSRRRVPKAKRA